MGHDISFPIDLPEDPSEWTIAETSVRGARRAWLVRHPLGTDVLLRRTRKGGWSAGIGRPTLMPHPDGGSVLRKTFHEDVAFATPPDLRRGDPPVALALRLLSAHHGGQARRLVAFLRACVRLHALVHGASISHVSQDRDPRTGAVALRPHAIDGSVAPRLPLEPELAVALSRALWSAHNLPTPLEAGIHDPVPTTAHGRLARRAALLAEAEALLDPTIPSARRLLDHLSDLRP